MASVNVAGEHKRFKCPLCAFYAHNIRLVLSHLRLVHSSDPRFSVVCGIGGCSTTSKSFSSLYQHIYRKHKDSGIIQSRTHKTQMVNCVDDGPAFFSADVSSQNEEFQEGLCIDCMLICTYNC